MRNKYPGPGRWCLLLLIFILPLLATSQNLKFWEGPFNREPFVEVSPSLSADGSRMVFVAYREANPELRQLFETHKKEDGEWSQPFPVSAINNAAGEGSDLGGCFLAADGNTLYFHANLEDSRGNTDLYYAIRKGYGWGEPVNLGDTINTDGAEKFPSLSPDGSELYFQRQAIPEKIYFPQSPKVLVSQRIRGTWDDPIWLPPPLNTGSTWAPRILPDGKTLIYTAEDSEKQNQLIFFITQRMAGTWQHPQPLNYLGPQSENSVAATSARMDTLVFAGSEGFFKTSLQSEYTPDAMKFASLSINDYITAEPVDTEITLISRSGKYYPIVTHSNPDDGKLLALLPADEDYDIQIELDGYAPVSRPLELSQFEAWQNKVALVPESVEAVFSITDIITGDEISGEVVLTDSLSRTVELTYDSLNMSYGASLKMKNTYQIQVNADKYQPFSREIRIDSLSSLQAVDFPMQLQRSFYDFSFRITDAIYEFVPEDVNFSVINLSNELALYPVYDAENQAFLVELDNDIRYRIKVEAYGYEPYESEIDAGQLINARQFIQQIRLKKEGQ